MSLVFAQRSAELERMDRELLDPITLRRLLKALERVNGLLGGVRATLRPLAQYAAGWRPGQTVRFIDWGTGGADVPRAIVRWCRARGFRSRVTAVDQQADIIGQARSRCRDYPEIELVQADIAGFAAPEKSFEYALSSLCMHHLTDDQIVLLLRKSDALASRGMIMNDLVRSGRAWAWIWALTRVLRAHPIVQHDAPLSVRRAFTPSELAGLAHRAGLPYLKVSKHFGYRLTLAGEKN